jgi:hypothetical protein
LLQYLCEPGERSSIDPAEVDRGLLFASHDAIGRGVARAQVASPA